MKSNSIYLIMVAEEFFHNVLPFPLLFVGATLKRAGYQVIVRHINPDRIDLTVDEICASSPLMVGFSVLTGMPTYRSAVMSKMIKEKTDIPIVWGGVHPSLLPEQCLNEPFIDFVVMGEGEEAAVELAHALSGRRNVSGIQGVGFKDTRGKIILQGWSKITQHLDNLPMDFSLINLDEYVFEEQISHNGKLLRMRSLGYYGSRGCPFACGFCYNVIYNQRRWRAPSADFVIKDILRLKEKYGLTKIHFWDDNFLANPSRAEEILRAINMFSGIDVRIDQITEKSARMMKELKVAFLLIGVESGSERLLGLINKGFRRERIVKAAKILGKYRIPALYSAIFGLPTETASEFNATVDLLLEIHYYHRESSFTTGMYLPFPGTDLYQLAIREGFKQPNTTEKWKLLDRWRNIVPLPWVNNDMCLNVRHLFYFLVSGSLLTRYWAAARLRYKWLKFRQDIRALILLRYLLKRIFMRKKHSKPKSAVSFSIKGRIYRYICTKTIFFINHLFGSYVSNKNKLINPKSIRKILIIHTNMAGDNVVATPMIRNLARHFRNAEITYLTCRYAAEVLFANPWIKDFILYDSCYDDKRKGLQLKWFSLLSMIGRKRFDMVIDTEEEISKIERSLLPVLSGARYRIGYNRSKGYRGILHTHEIPYKLNMHGAERLLDITRFLSIEIVDKHFEVYFNAGDSTHIRRLHERYGISEEDFVIGIHAGNTNRGKLWNQEKFAQTADRLAEMLHARIVFTGALADKSYLDEIIQHMNHPALNISGQTTFPQLSAFIARCGLLITLDTVSVHIAAATCTPTVGIYIQTYRSGWLPWNKEKQRFITGYHTCNGCSLGNYLDKITPAGAQTSICKKNFICAEAISVAQVIALAQEVVETHAPGKAYR